MTTTEIVRFPCFSLASEEGCTVWWHGTLTCQVEGCIFFKYGPCPSPKMLHLQNKTKKATQTPGFGKLQLHCAGKLN